MKINRVELTGFGPYRGHEVVDFDAFDDGLFLITGRTGAGKSSILDAVTYALFGRIPRYESVAGDKVRSDHLEPTELCEVVLDFTVPAGRHRVRRSPAYQRPKQRGTGLTTVRATFQLEVERDGEWVVIETKEGNADRHVSDVLPLTAEQFQQVILLAQGQFQELLVAGSEKRRELLSKLFDTSRFTAYSADLDERARVLRRQVEKKSAQISVHATGLARQVGLDLPATVEISTGDGLSEWAADVLASAAGASAEARTERDGATAAWERDSAGLEQARQVVERQQRLNAARARQVELNDAQSAVDEARSVVDGARRAAAVVSALRSRDARLRDAAAAAAALSEHAQHAPAQNDDSGAVAAPADINARLEGWGAELAGVDEALRVEQSIPTLRRAVDEAEHALEAFDARRATTQERRETGERELAALTSSCDDLEVALVALGDAPTREESARQGVAAARERSTCLTDRSEALVQQAQAHREVTRASAELSALLDRQLAEYAGVLAAELVPGTACQVCGSDDHPAPARLVEGHVDEQSLTAARDAATWASKRAAEADTALVRIDTRLVALEERCAGRDLAGWEAEAVEARSQLAELQETRSRLDRSRTAAASLRDDLARLARAADQEHASRAELLAKRARAEADLQRDSERVRDVLGEYPSLAERRDHLRALRSWWSRLAELHERVEQAHTAAEQAERELADVLVEQGFATAAAAQEAYVAPERVAELADHVARHDALAQSVQATLAAPELQDLPVDPVDVEPWAQACAASGVRHRAALQAYGSAEQQHSTVVTMVDRIEADLAASALVRREYSLVNGLAATLRGQGQNERRMALEAFALAAELEEIVAAANVRLARMTHGRFTFQHSDTEESKRQASGLGLEVMDAHTGESRSPRSLSGGEKFQAALALALGLAEVVTARAGGIRLDTLFIDEGFGTLDPETLEATMATLDGLREGGRTIGLISHVTTLKESIACQLHVETTSGGWSTIRQP